MKLVDWKATHDTLHLWTQIVGKIRLVQSPHLNHWWEAALYVTTQGLATGPIPHGKRSFELELNFVRHALFIRVDDGRVRAIPLEPMTVAQFYREVMSTLARLQLQVWIDPHPQELALAIRFDEDHIHETYRREPVERFFAELRDADRLCREFRAGFIGKCSPVHFFWGSFDLAATRFSGRLAPAREGADHVTRDAYSHEVISCGYWPGGGIGDVGESAYYAYAAPEPEGFALARMQPRGARYNPQTHGFVLPVDGLRRLAEPDLAVLDFFESTYATGARLGDWDRETLERPARPSICVDDERWRAA